MADADRADSVTILRGGRRLAVVADTEAARQWFVENEFYTLSHGLKHGYRVVDSKGRDVLVPGLTHSFDVKEQTYDD